MTKKISLLAVALSVLAMVVCFSSYMSTKQKKEHEVSVNIRDFFGPIGIDENGNTAVCSESGYAFDISHNGGIQAVTPRSEHGRLTKCLSKPEVKEYFLALGESEDSINEILIQYPDFDATK
jgi:hypothetical protein